MSKLHSEPSSVPLPRIFSTGKLPRSILSNPTEHKQTEQSVRPLERPRSQNRMHSQRKTTLSSANSSKAVRLQTTTLIYLKKIEALEKQQFLIDREMLSIQQQIAALRVKSKAETENANSTISSRASVRPSENSAKMKLETIRRRVDKENEQVKKVMGEVDKARREIQATKKLNTELESELSRWTQRLQEESSIAAELDKTLSAKNAEAQKRKIDAAHQKAYLIKNYDAILRKLDGELVDQTTRQTEARSDFYLTDVYTHHQGERKERKGDLPENSPKARKMAAQVTWLREKVDELNKNSEAVKQKTGAQSLEEVKNIFTKEYEVNFERYNYLNERYAHLQDLKQRNAELELRKAEFSAQVQEKKHTKSSKMTETTKQKIEETKLSKSKLHSQIHGLDELFYNLKAFLCNLSIAQCLPIEQQQITRENIAFLLEQVQRQKEGGQSKEVNEGGETGRGSSLTHHEQMASSSRSHHLEEQLEAVKRQSVTDKLLEREQFLRLGEKGTKRKISRGRTQGS